MAVAFDPLMHAAAARVRSGVHEERTRPTAGDAGMVWRLISVPIHLSADGNLATERFSDRHDWREWEWEWEWSYLGHS